MAPRRPTMRRRPRDLIRRAARNVAWESRALAAMSTSILERSRLRVASLGLALAVASAGSLTAHDLGTVQVYGSFRHDGTYQIDVVMDEEHLKMAQLGGPTRRTRYGSIESLDGALANRMGRFLCDLADATTLRFDGEVANPRLAIAPPDPGSPPRPGRAVLRLSGEIPGGVHTADWRIDLPIGRYPVVLRNEGDEIAVWKWVEGNTAAPRFALAASVVPPPSPPLLRVAANGAAGAFREALGSPAELIVLALGIFFSSRRISGLLVQWVLASVGWGVGLVCAAQGWGPSRSLLSGLVARALSAIAADNVVAAGQADREGRGRFRQLLRGVLILAGATFCGLATAGGGSGPGSGSLSGLGRWLGVLGREVGFGASLAVLLAIAFLLLGVSYRWQPWYRQRVVIPGSTLAAVLALYWSATRLL
jgi:hypothetical protein